MSALPVTGAPWWAPLAGAVIGAVLTAALTIYREGDARERQIASWWIAVAAEVDLCRSLADAYLTGKVVMAPSYRWPTVAYENIVPQLLGIAQLSAEDTQALLLFYTEVEALNRGLDYVHEHMDDEKRRDMQFKTNLLKVGHIKSSGDRYLALRDVLKRHMEDPRWA
jgi:hypothetical protein